VLVGGINEDAVETGFTQQLFGQWLLVGPHLEVDEPVSLQKLVYPQNCAGVATEVPSAGSRGQVNVRLHLI
jgi:hypothetical protein